MRPIFYLSCLAACAAASPAFSDSSIYNDPSYYQTYRRAPGAPAAQATAQPRLGRPAYANEIKSNSSDYDFAAGIDLGARNDKLKWNIASDISGTATPNILSELTWKGIGGYQAQPHLEYTSRTGALQGIHLEASAYKSYTYKGSNQDSDYLGNGRTLEFSRSNNSADDGHAEGYSAGLGYAFDFKGGRERTLARFTALVGYSQQQQTYTMTNGNQTISGIPGFTPDLGPFPGLHSSYQAVWRAPFVGLGLTSYFAENHRFKLQGRYYNGTYRGDANWNLRTDFMHPKSYSHKADADGFQIGLEYGWMFRPQWELTLAGNFEILRTDPGIDTTYLSTGSVLTTRLNKVQWNSQQYTAGINYLF